MKGRFFFIIVIREPTLTVEVLQPNKKNGREPPTSTGVVYILTDFFFCFRVKSHFILVIDLIGSFISGKTFDWDYLYSCILYIFF
jgi:hypothetical protein